MTPVSAQRLLGQVQWNLPAELEYEPGQSIQTIVSVTNPTTTTREYQLYLGFFDVLTGGALETSVVPVNDQQSFMVPEGSVATITGQLVAARTDVILKLSLIDVATQSTAGQVTVRLRTPPTTLERLMPLVWLGAAFGIFAGIVTPMVTGLVRK